MVCVGGFIALFPTPLPHQFNYSLPAWLKQFLSFHIPGFHGHCPEQASTGAAQNRLASFVFEHHAKCFQWLHTPYAQETFVR